MSFNGKRKCISMKAMLRVFLATVRCFLCPLPEACVIDWYCGAPATGEARERMNVCCD